MYTRECLVVEPPTAGELRLQYADAIANRKLLKVTLLDTRQEVPKPTPIDVFVDIKHTGHPDFGTEGILKITGWQVDSDGNQPEIPVSITIQAPTDPIAEATAILVTSED